MHPLNNQSPFHLYYPKNISYKLIFNIDKCIKVLRLI